MDPGLDAKIERLRKLAPAALRAQYRELFGVESRSGNRQFLFRRVAWRLQALAQGDLSERARKRALELANDADLRIQPLRVLAARDGPAHRDPRLPPAGTVLRRSFDGQTVEVRVLEDGFE